MEICRNIVKGAVGGILIAVGVLSAIGCTESSWAVGTALIAAGAAAAILLDFLGNFKIGIFYCAVLVAGKYIFWPAECLASGAVMYLGCVLALPEMDSFTNALTGAAAAAGFIAALAFDILLLGGL